MQLQALDLDRCELKFAQPEGEFSGYGAVFGGVDSKNDVIVPGAFADVIKSGNPIHVYVNHNWLRGELPIGAWSGLTEDAKGFKGDASLQMKMPAAANGYWAAKSGLVRGLSIAFKVHPDGAARNAEGTRMIHRMQAVKEISIVTDPANPEAQITGFKFFDPDMISAIDEMKTIRDFERLLRDVGSLDQAVAKAIAVKARDIFVQRDVGEDADAQMQVKIQALFDRATARINR